MSLAVKSICLSIILFCCLFFFATVTFADPLQIEAKDGGVVDLGSVAQIIGYGDGLQITAQGENSEVRLDALTHLLAPVDSGPVGLKVGSGARIILNPDLTVLGSGVTLMVNENGTVSAGTLELGLGAVLTGKGMVDGHLTNGGIVSPGEATDGTGILTVSGNFTQKSTGLLTIDIFGDQPGNGFDVCNIGGDIFVDGEIVVSGAQGFVPFMDSRFTVLSAVGNRNGAFADASGLSLPGGGLFTLAYEENSVDLAAIGSGFIDAVGPTITSVTLDGALLQEMTQVQRPVVIHVDAQDPSGIGQVTLAVDGQQVAVDTDGADGYEFLWNISQFVDGEHQLSLTVFDSFGNASAIDHTITIALVLPDVPVLTQPVPGVVTNTRKIAIAGTVSLDVERVNVFLNGSVAGEAIVAGGQGFGGYVILNDGINRLQVQAVNRAGSGPLSEIVTVSLDRAIPPAPEDLVAQSREMGRIRLDWAASTSNGIDHYEIYRHTWPFLDLAQAVKINPQPITATSYDDMPVAEGTYFYRVVAVNQAGTFSAASNQISANADRTPPRALQIAYVPSGAFDLESLRYGVGRITVQITVSEALSVSPFLTVTPLHGIPKSIPLTETDDLIYQGTLEIVTNTPSGTAYAVFSARDKVGNRGTEIEAGASLRIDTDGPEVILLTVTPAEPIQNSATEPAAVQVHIQLSEAVKTDEHPELFYTLSASQLDPLPLLLTQSADTMWAGTLILSAQAGQDAPETLAFSFQAMDDLYNRSNTINGASRFQVYQDQLPPLSAPQELTAIARPAGRIYLEWQPVYESADYQLFRQAPGETELTPLIRSNGLTQWEDTTPEDGSYVYAVASVRSANAQESVSGMSDSVTVVADSLAPTAPGQLQLTLQATGIRADWQAPGGEVPAAYRLYRSDQSYITSTQDLPPILDDIKATTALDSRPSGSDHTYAVTAIDAAGNESAPSDSVYLNFNLLPVASFEVVQTDNDIPELTWDHPNPQTVAGYDLYIGEGEKRFKINGFELWTETSYLDRGFGDNNRHYTVVAVDADGSESLERSLVLPKLEIAPEFEGRIQRGLFNSVTCWVRNVSGAAVEHARLQVTFNVHEHYSEFFDLAAGEEKRVSLIIGGFDDLMGLAEYNATVEILPNPEERVRIVRAGTVEVGVGILAMELITKQMIRGATGKVRFTLENPGDVDVEIITARNHGSEFSDEIGFSLLDEDENLLMTAGYRQVLGEQVITLANGTTVARIPAKGKFESQWIDLPVPEAASDTVFVKAVIDRLHYRTGQDDEIVINGVSVVREATTMDTEYLCELIDVSPATSFGDEEIVIIGQARDRQTDMTVSFAPLRLVLAGNGFERSIDLETQADGGFTYRYAPLPADSGVYRVSCIHPDLLERPEQGTFTIAGVQISPQNIRLSMPRQYEQTLNLTVTAGRGTTAHDLELQFLPVDQETGNLPEGITVTLPAPVNLGSVQSAALAPTIFADTDAPESGEIVLRLVSNESGGNPLAMARIAFHLSEAKPVLSVNPSYIDTGVVHDQIINEKIMIKNNGLADLTDTTVNLMTDDGRAAPEWISIVSNRNVGRLSIGQASEIVLEARPDETVVEKSYQFLLQVRGAEIVACNVPISVLVTQNGEGNVLFHLSDLYTATLDENNKLISGLAGAKLELQYESVSGVSESQTTDNNGEALFTDLTAGYYKFRATAAKHQQVIGRLQVKPGITVAQEVFLDYNLVTVEWEVNEITLEDRYEIILHTTYETDVPAPVLVIKPTGINLPDMQPGEVYYGELTLINHGLVQAEDVKFYAPQSDELYSYDFLPSVPDTIKPHQRVTIPYRIVKQATYDSTSPASESGGGGDGNYVKCAPLHYCFTCPNGERRCLSVTVCWFKVDHKHGGTVLPPSVVIDIDDVIIEGPNIPNRISSPVEWIFCDDCGDSEPITCEVCNKSDCIPELNSWMCKSDAEQNAKPCGITPETECHVCNNGECIRPDEDCGVDEEPTKQTTNYFPPVVKDTISFAASMLNLAPILKDVSLDVDVTSTKETGKECCLDCNVADPKEYEENSVNASITLSGSVSSPTKPSVDFQILNKYRLVAEVGAGLEGGVKGTGSATYTDHDTACEGENCENINLQVKGEITGEVGGGATVKIEDRDLSCLLLRHLSGDFDKDCILNTRGIQSEVFGKIKGKVGLSTTKALGESPACDSNECRLEFGGVDGEITLKFYLDVPFTPKQDKIVRFPVKFANPWHVPCSEILAGGN